MTSLALPVVADLPIALRAGDIARAIAGHPVTLVVGATGSGKSTHARERSASGRGGARAR